MAYFRETIAGVVLLLILGLGTVAWHYRGAAASAEAKAAQLRNDLSAATTANAANQEAIRKLNLQIALNDKVVAELDRQKTQILSALNFSNHALSDLKASHEDVRAYLDAPVPDALRRLYDGKAVDRGADPDYPAKRAGGAAGARSGAMER